jgi:hypothetical protein
MGSPTEGDQPLLAALASHPDHLGRQVDILAVAAHQLGNPHASGVKHLHHRSVAAPVTVRGRRRFQQAEYLVHGEEGGQGMAEFRADDAGHGIGFDHLLAKEEAEKGP